MLYARWALRNDVNFSLQSTSTTEMTVEGVEDVYGILTGVSIRINGCKVADGGREGVVIEGDIVLAPEQHDLDRGGQDQADGVAKFGGPLERRPQRRVGPVALGDQPADFTARPLRHVAPLPAPKFRKT